MFCLLCFGSLGLDWFCFVVFVVVYLLDAGFSLTLLVWIPVGVV